MLAGQSHAGRRLHGGNGGVHIGPLVRPQLQQSFLQLEPVTPVRDGFRFGEEAQNDAQGLVHAFPLQFVGNAHHVGVAGQRAGADAEQHAAIGHVVQLHHAVRHHQRVMIRQADHAGAQLDAVGALRRRGDEHLRRGDNLPAGAVVLADPGFVKPQLVQPFDEFKIALHSQRGVFANAVERAEEYAKLHSLGKRHIRTSSG